MHWDFLYLYVVYSQETMSVMCLYTHAVEVLTRSSNLDLSVVQPEEGVSNESVHASVNIGRNCVLLIVQLGITC